MNNRNTMITLFTGWALGNLAGYLMGLAAPNRIPGSFRDWVSAAMVLGLILAFGYALREPNRPGEKAHPLAVVLMAGVMAYAGYHWAYFLTS